MRIRQLGPGDEDSYREIRLRALAEAPTAFGSTYEREAAFTREVWTTRLNGLDSAMFLAEAAPDRAVGLAGCLLAPEPPGRGHLVSVWVDPAERGKGIGRALIARILTWARAHDLTELELWVTETNEIARSLYLGAGFNLTGERQPLPSDPRLSEVQLTRSI